MILQALPRHVGPLSLQNILFEQNEFYPGKPIPEGALRFPRFPRRGLRHALALSMESIGIDGMNGDKILCHHLR
jgi:hypothetical protein